MAELDSQLALMHRSLMDGLSHADDLVSGSRNGFHIDAICKAMSDVLEHGNTCFEHHAQQYPATQEAFEFDGLAGTSWHEIASLWLHRLVQHIADLTGRQLTGGPTEDGSFTFVFLPPIMNESDLANIQIAYKSPNRLETKLKREHSNLGPGGSDSGRKNTDVADQTIPLTENDRSILEAMLELGATSDMPKTAVEVVDCALSRESNGKDFQRLKKKGYVEAKAGTGYWLTEQGLKAAKTCKNQ